MRVMPIDGGENFAPMFLNRELREWTHIFPSYKTIRVKLGKEGSIYFVIHPGDHNPPHLHAEYQGDEIVISIPMNGTDAFEVMRGTLKHREANAALKWCEKNRGYIKDNWSEFCAGVYSRD